MVASPKDAIEHFKRAISLGNGNACGELSLIYQGPREMLPFEMQLVGPSKQAFELATRGHEMGSVISTSALARCYLEGVGVPQHIERSSQLARTAARAGDSLGMHLLARCLEIEGKAGRKEIFEWYRRAASLGHTDSAACARKYEPPAHFGAVYVNAYDDRDFDDFEFEPIPFKFAPSDESNPKRRKP